MFKQSERRGIQSCHIPPTSPTSISASPNNTASAHACTTKLRSMLKFTFKESIFHLHFSNHGTRQGLIHNYFVYPSLAINLIGLGLKFCIKTPQTKNETSFSLHWFYKDVLLLLKYNITEASFPTIKDYI